jgi:hypothetical protein
MERGLSRMPPAVKASFLDFLNERVRTRSCRDEPQGTIEIKKRVAKQSRKLSYRTLGSLHKR